MPLPATKAAPSVSLELVKPSGGRQRATAPTAVDAEMAARSFSRDEQVQLYREGIDSLRDMARNGKDTARATAAAKLATLFRDASLTRSGTLRVKVLFVDPRECLDLEDEEVLPVEIVDAEDAPEDFIA